jgi:hypothetical protein
MLGDVPSSNFKYETPSKGGAHAKKQPDIFDTKLTSTDDEKGTIGGSIGSGGFSFSGSESAGIGSSGFTFGGSTAKSVKFADGEADHKGVGGFRTQSPVAASVGSAVRKQSSSKPAPQAPSSVGNIFDTKLTSSDDKKPTLGGRNSDGFSFGGTSTATDALASGGLSFGKDTKPAGTSGEFSFGGSTVSTGIGSCGFIFGGSAAKTRTTPKLSSKVALAKEQLLTIPTPTEMAKLLHSGINRITAVGPNEINKEM